MAGVIADDLQRIALEHLDACEAAMDAADENCLEDTDSPASAPYDGCSSCQARELAWAMASELQRRGLAS